MTEDDAKKNLCCAAMGHPASDFNDGVCVASRCMAWRWHYEMQLMGWSKDKNEPIHAGKNTHGYCGLAGKP